MPGPGLVSENTSPGLWSASEADACGGHVALAVGVGGLAAVSGRKRDDFAIRDDWTGASVAPAIEGNLPGGARRHRRREEVVVGVIPNCAAAKRAVFNTRLDRVAEHGTGRGSDEFVASKAAGWPSGSLGSRRPFRSSRSLGSGRTELPGWPYSTILSGRTGRPLWSGRAARALWSGGSGWAERSRLTPRAEHAPHQRAFVRAALLRGRIDDTQLAARLLPTTGNPARVGRHCGGRGRPRRSTPRQRFRPTWRPGREVSSRVPASCLLCPSGR